jgi:hypothetical protein
LDTGLIGIDAEGAQFLGQESCSLLCRLGALGFGLGTLLY